ncbi:acyltransferase [Streptomyces sp. TS71-3]|uniref:acyltransferase family protein n=1 Tax=Streptomyces sp. TS71-3 TaxID=2733862 RepID=UPI001B0FA624|nr:acyltransferase [Streptomyces sp. TS71-3]GHJ38953.1 acyltransferase [Streptomyces sp. TS71-3]
MSASPTAPARVPASPAQLAVDTSRTHAHALDGMRALAALMVIALHTGIYSGQVASSWLGIGHGGALGPVLSRFTVGVPIFFVLSGLLLYRPYANAGRDGAPRPPTGRYLWHRALRILPAYWAVTLVALAAFTPDALTHLWATVRPLALLHIYQANVIPAGITQTWSLATEASFYVLLPLLALALHPLLRRPAAVLVALGALEAVSVASVVLTHLPSAGPYPAAGFWLPQYIGYFAAGMALAVLASRGAGLGALARHPWACWGVAVAAYAVESTPLTGSTSVYPTVPQALLQHLLDLVVAVALVAPLVLRTERGPARLLSHRVPARLGRISYAVFLWHMVVVETFLRLTGEPAGSATFAVLFPATVAVTVLIAVASDILIERPARRLRRSTAVTPRSTRDDQPEPVTALGGQPPAARDGAA